MCELSEKIQASELEVMRVLWKKGEPMALIDIRRELAERRSWEDSTVKTLLRRLCEKKVVELKSRGMYSALVTEAEYRRWSMKSYLGKMFDGSAKKLVATLVSDGELSEEDFAELYEVLNGGKRNE